VRHADYATFSTGVPYSPDAHHPDWEKFLDRVLPDEHTRRWIQTLVGYSLQGGNPERVLVIAKGETTSGKSTFAEALRAALGRYAGPFNLSLFRERQDEGPRADIVGSLARRMLFASEASAEWTLHADSVKRFTGGDPVQARRLNSNALIERVPAFTPWLVTNSYPQIPGADLALWRRLKAAPFGASIPEAEVDLGVRVRVLSPEGRAAVLAWAVAGWDLYCRDGLGDPSPEAVEMLAEAQDEMSELDLCISQIFVRGPEYAAPAVKLFEAYRNWVMMHGDERRALTMTAFGRALSGKGFSKVRRGEGPERAWWRQGVAVDPNWKM
jgi:putative DNA primase/helicase